MDRLSDATWRAESGVKYSYCVDLVPPPEGFSDEFDEEILEFVERCSSTFDLCGEITDRDALVRYCLGASTCHRVRSHFTTENFSDEVEELSLVFLGVTLALSIRPEIATRRSLLL